MAQQPYMPVQIRKETRDRLREIAERNRTTLADAADIAVEAWHRLSPEEQMRIIRREHEQPEQAASVA